MHYTFVGIGIYLTIFQLVTIVYCQCPEYFRYFRDEKTGEIMGTVEIPNPPQGVPLQLRVILSVATVLPTKYVGRIELAKSKEESIKAILHGTSLYYRIYFPVRHPIPAVMSISLNSFQYCTGPPAIGAIITNIMLEHVLYPARVVIPLTDQLLNFISNHTSLATTTSSSVADATNNKRTTTTDPDERETTVRPNDFSLVRPSLYKADDSSCGLISKSNPFASNVDPTSTAFWPWLVAIYVLRDRLDFQCSGNLISKRHVLTTARCLKDGKDNISPDTMLVSLGRSDLWNWNDPDAVDIGVSKYHIHSKFINRESSDNDIAIIKLAKPINITRKIRPICLWIGKPDLDDVIDRSGYVIGWDKNANSKGDIFEPVQLKMSIVAQMKCLQSNDRMKDIISSRTFCAGQHDGINPCRLISNGSGFAMHHARYERYHLRGVVSTTLTDSKLNLCDSENYIVFIDIAKYLPWIHRLIV